MVTSLKSQKCEECFDFCMLEACSPTKFHDGIVSDYSKDVKNTRCVAQTHCLGLNFTQRRDLAVPNLPWHSGRQKLHIIRKSKSGWPLPCL